MLRKFHLFFGLIASFFVIILSVSGFILSVNPLLERSQAIIAGTDLITVADLAGTLSSRYSNIEQIKRSPSGQISVYYIVNDESLEDIVSPLTGDKITQYSTPAYVQSSAFMSWMKTLHRSFLLDTQGRAVAGITSLCMLLLALSGLNLLAHRFGGWRRLLSSFQEPLSAKKSHAQVGRWAALAILLSSITSLYLSASSFELIPERASSIPLFPEQVNGSQPASVSELAALGSIPMPELRELTYPYQDDPYDVYSITTNAGTGYIDQSTGELLSFQKHSFGQQVYELIYMLHTGEGLWWLGLILGIFSLSIPFMAWTGIKIWIQRTKIKKVVGTKFVAQAVAQQADTIILVASENNSTWGFAKTLQLELEAKNYLVYCDSMNNLALEYENAERIILLVATYGDGDAPSSANRFLTKLNKMNGVDNLAIAVVGFGDRQFPKFCQFAEDVNAALVDKGCRSLLPLTKINRQSTQEFSRWGFDLASVLGISLELTHKPIYPKKSTIKLIEKIEYGKQVNALISVLRFDSNSKLPSFDAGDLIGVLFPDSEIPRFYSLASNSKEGILEICVKLLPGGLCSIRLNKLKLGESIDVFIQPNPSFRPESGKAPLILIGAGTGIAPLVGFIRNNKTKRPIYLYWGGRHPDSDFLYKSDLKSYLEDGRLSSLQTAFSRVEPASYVQDRLMSDTENIGNLISKGAQVLVCGSSEMALGVKGKLEVILNASDSIQGSFGMTLDKLKSERRYREDVY